MSAEETATEPKIDPKINAILKRLEDLIPLFKEHRPEGWVDFRDKELSKGWRSGLYINSDAPVGKIEVKALFGSQAAALLAGLQFETATALSVSMDRSSADVFWSVRMSFTEAEVTW